MASADSTLRTRGKFVAPITAPKPMLPFRMPYPIAPWCRSLRATTASKAQTALTKRVKMSVRIKAACSIGA